MYDSSWIAPVTIIVGVISVVFWVVAGTNWANTARDTAQCRELLEKVVGLLEARD